MGILLYYLKYLVNFPNFKSYCFPLIYQIEKQLKKEKFVQNLSKWELKYSPRAENPEKMINIYKKVTMGEWNIYYHIFVACKMHSQMIYFNEYEN